MELHLGWFHQCLFPKWTTWWGQGEQAGNGNLQGHSCHWGGEEAQEETELKNWRTARFKDSKCYSAPAKHTLHGKTYPYSKSFHFSEEFRLLGFSALAQRFKIRCCYCCSATQSCPTLWPHGLQHPRLPCPLLYLRVCSNSCSLSWWYHPTLSPLSPLFLVFPSIRVFSLMSRLSASGGQSIGA